VMAALTMAAAQPTPLLTVMAPVMQFSWQAPPKPYAVQMKTDPLLPPPFFQNGGGSKTVLQVLPSFGP